MRASGTQLLVILDLIGFGAPYPQLLAFLIPLPMSSKGNYSWVSALSWPTIFKKTRNLQHPMDHSMSVLWEPFEVGPGLPELLEANISLPGQAYLLRTHLPQIPVSYLILAIQLAVGFWSLILILVIFRTSCSEMLLKATPGDTELFVNRSHTLGLVLNFV